MSARVTNNLTQWIKFFLVGVIETSKAQLKYLKDEAFDYCFYFVMEILF